MNDQRILELFKSGQRQKAFQKLYRLYPKIETLIRSKGGQKQDAKDVFQEGLIILYRNLQKSDFKLTSSFYTYLHSVCRFLWSDMQKKNSKTTSETFELNQEEIPNLIEGEKKYRLAETAFSELGERCQQLLLLFYHQKKSFIDIAQAMHFKSEKIAKNQKYKCLKKARDIFRGSLNQVQS